MIQQSPAITKSFLKAINKAAMQKCNDIALQIEQTTNEAMRLAEEEASREGHQRINLAKAKIVAHAKMVVATFEKEKKIEIYKKRLAYENEIFESVTKKLVQFTKTDEYKQYLKKVLLNLSDRVGTNPTFYVSPADAYATSVIQAHFPEANIKTDPLMRIGGIKVRDDEHSILMDCSLDSKLENEREWFLLHSGLKVDF